MEVLTSLLDEDIIDYQTILGVVITFSVFERDKITERRSPDLHASFIVGYKRDHEAYLCAACLSWVMLALKTRVAWLLVSGQTT